MTLHVNAESSSSQTQDVFLVFCSFNLFHEFDSVQCLNVA